MCQIERRQMVAFWSLKRSRLPETPSGLLPKREPTGHMQAWCSLHKCCVDGDESSLEERMVCPKRSDELSADAKAQLSIMQRFESSSFS